MPWARILCALFVAYLVGTAVHLGFVMAHEPFSFDAWNVAVDTRAQAFSIERWFDYWAYEYTHANPRLGQSLTYLSYKLEYFAVIATPIAYLAMSLAITVLGIGRWPWRRARDLALWAIAIGFGWFALPELGRNMFCRAYGANYIYGAAIQLWFLVPLRLARNHEARLSRRSVWLYAFAGAIAGMCNEHTGPALIVLLAGLAWCAYRRGEPAGLPRAGALGILVGFVALWFAPGQGERYDGLAERTSMVMRVIQRGAIGNLDIVRDYVVFAAPLLAVIVIALVASDRDKKPATRLVAIALATGLAMTVTLFASPKLGSRFYIMPMALLLAATLALVDVALSPRRWIALVILAGAASGYAANRTVPLYARVADQSAERLAALAASRAGDVVVAEAFEQIEESWWFIGDDFRDYRKRRMVAAYFGLARVMLRGWDPKSPLGTTGIRVVARYEIGGEPRETELEIAETSAPSVDVVLASAREAYDLLRRDRPLDRFEVVVEFVGRAPALPRPRIVVARANGGELEGYAGTIAHPGVARTRELQIPAALRDKRLEVFVVQIGSDVRRLGTTGDAVLSYTPWRTGIYWALACDASACWLFAASRNHG